MRCGETSGGNVPPSFSFPSSHRLKRRSLIRPLFERARADVGSVATGCVRVVYRIVTRDEAGQDVPVQVGFSAGRGVRKAVDRNGIKRILREVYRVHQHSLVDLFCCTDECLTLMILFRGDPADVRTCVPRDLPRAVEKIAGRLRSASGDTAT